MQSLASDTNRLGGRLLQAVHVTPSRADLTDTRAAGTFVSPLGVSLALALLLNGAREGSQVQGELQKLLSKGSTTAELNKHYHALLGLLLQHSSSSSGSTDQGVTLSLATSIWAKAPLKFTDKYAASMAETYRAVARDLTGAKPVNDWCSEETRGLIKEVIDEGAASKMDALLASAVYFKGKWAHEFDRGNTQALPFTLGSNAGAMDAAMMFRRFKGREVEYLGGRDGNASLQGVRLPYKGGKFAGIALLPAASTGEEGPSRLLQQMAVEEGFVGGLRFQKGPEVHLWMPRFKMESELKLKGALQQLGVPSAFSPSAPDDYAPMLGQGQQMMVDEVIHKVFVQVDEEGTEAAAFTGVMMMRCAAPMGPPPVMLKFDRPFVFGVQHVESGLMLFAGVVEKPESWQDAGAAAAASGGPPPGYPTAQ